MLSRKRSFVVTIGDYGAVVALHDDNKIKTKIFLEDLTEESKIDLKNLFSKNHSLPVSVILDTIDQSYKKKSYPPIKKSDLEQIIKRDMTSDGDNESFKGYILNDNRKKSGKKAVSPATRSDCIFVSTSNSEAITKWIDFLLEMPNHVLGIYMLPIESFNLLSLLKKDIKDNSRAKNTGLDSIYFVIIQNKVSGVRQIIFSDHSIVFTRSVTYDFKERDFLEKYEQDIYSTFEYLKRLIPDVRISEIDIINIFSSDAISQIKTISSSELNFVNYTPFEAATKIGYVKILPENSNYCDLLISKVFSNSKKILKFTTPRIKILERFFTGLRYSYYFNVLLSAVLILSALIVFVVGNKNTDLLSKAESAKLLAMEELSGIKLPNATENALTENGNVVEIERMIDFGKVNELMTSIGADISTFYNKLRFVKNNDVKLEEFQYSLQSFEYKNPTKTKYSFVVRGVLSNSSGDIDDLFKGFDFLTSNTKKTFEDQTIRFTEIPRNIDFVQKYYTLPIEFTVSQ